MKPQSERSCGGTSTRGSCATRRPSRRSSPPTQINTRRPASGGEAGRRSVPGTLESSTRNPGNRSIAIAAVRFITPDVAIADGPYEIAGGGTVRRMWTTLVLEREAGVWRIAAIRNMVPTGGAAQRPQ